MQISILWNVSISLKSGKKHLIFSGFRDCECAPEEMMENIKAMTDELINDLDRDIKNAFLRFGYKTEVLIEMKRVDVK